MTTVISVRGLNRGLLLADMDFIYVGRQCAGWRRSKWGNLWRVSRRQKPLDEWHCATSAEAIARYSAWITKAMIDAPEAYCLSDIRGKRLGCWCGFWQPGKPEIACHAVILAKLADSTR